MAKAPAMVFLCEKTMIKTTIQDRDFIKNLAGSKVIDITASVDNLLFYSNGVSIVSQLEVYKVMNPRVDLNLLEGKVIKVKGSFYMVRGILAEGEVSVVYKVMVL